MKSPQSPSFDRIVLGIDPGTNVLGYGLIGIAGRRVEMIAMGVIDLRKVGDIYLKLGRIYERVMGIIDAFHPDEMAIEAPFFGKNVQSMLKLGRAQGVVIAAAMARHIPIHEYAPLQIKQHITGSGAASKEQVASFMQRYLNIADDQLLPYLDATDALAAAYAHHLNTMTTGVKSQLPKMMAARTERKASTSWADFAKNNADRIR
ncbi:MAG: crossover junction endodeoxyribonuclease RuvC [Bacteroidaceae bacterium]|nr:crossover junction endodeoxyribonuclease RuvC [Bacteroidaceae bacterium]